MRFCFIADGQSPHARNWIRYLIADGHEVHLISTYPCSTHDLPVASLNIVPLDFSARVRAKEKEATMGTTQADNKAKSISRLRGSILWKTLVAVRNGVTPAAVQMQKHKVRRIVEQVQPDLVHAMRVPFEGILAASALKGTKFPLIISIWGNDFTLFAANSPQIAKLTRKAMHRADGVHPDCNKDLRLAREWGFGQEKPGLVAPGNGGVVTEIFRAGIPDAALAAQYAIPLDAPIIINPRGLKSYIRTDTFFEAIPLVLKRHPSAVFLGAAMEGKAVSETWTARLGIAKSVRLLPPVTHNQMAGLFRLSAVTVSPSEHDGTPNTLLESMACGSFPVAGNIEPVREWITDKENGLLFDPGNPQEMADAVCCAIEDESLRNRAAEINRRIICERADHKQAMAKAQEFYRDVIAAHTRQHGGKA